jgi:large subunit ribosomal protein L7/L12
LRSADGVGEAVEVVANMAKLEDIVDALSAMTVLEVVQLAKALEDAWGVDPAPIAVAGRPTAANPRDVDTYLDPCPIAVVLMHAGDRKVAVIKLVRELLGLDLREATHLVEGAPKELKYGVSMAEAKAMKKKFEEVGATAEIK